MNIKLKSQQLTPEVMNKIINNNINNMFYLSIYIISFEILMLVLYPTVKNSMVPAYQLIYLVMYLFFLLFGALSFFLLTKRRKQKKFNYRERCFFIGYTNGFVLVVMLWGMIITLLDQPSYGQIIAFVTNYVCCASLLLIRPHVFFFLEAIPLTALFLLLPFFQADSGILMGHYINLVIMVIPLTIGSYRSYTIFLGNTISDLKIRELSERDELTGLYNRRKMNHYIEREMNDCQTLGILMLDVDFFKKYNDTYGHCQGDHVLCSIGVVLQAMEKNYGIFAARYGGEEFIVFIKDQSLEKVSEIAVETQRRIDSLHIPHKSSDVSDMVTVSIGVGYCGKCAGQRSYEIISKADEALYGAKRMGRNQIYKAL